MKNTALSADLQIGMFAREITKISIMNISNITEALQRKQVHYVKA